MNPTANSVTSMPPSIPSSESSNSTTAMSHSKTTRKCHNQLCKQGPGAVVGVVIAVAFCLGFAALALNSVHSKKFKNVKTSKILASDIIKMPKEFTYKNLKSATKSFDSTRIIGHGAFDPVYKGIIPENGEVVVIKWCRGNGNLVKWVWSLHREGRLLSVADSRLNGEFEEGEMRRVLLVGLACSHPNPMARPSMRGVVQMLVGKRRCHWCPELNLP